MQMNSVHPRFLLCGDAALPPHNITVLNTLTKFYISGFIARLSMTAVVQFIENALCLLLSLVVSFLSLVAKKRNSRHLLGFPRVYKEWLEEAR